MSGAALERGEKITLVGAASPFFCYTAILLEKEQKKKACRIRMHALIDIYAYIEILICGGRLKTAVPWVI